MGMAWGHARARARFSDFQPGLTLASALQHAAATGTAPATSTTVHPTHYRHINNYCLYTLSFYNEP